MMMEGANALRGTSLPAGFYVHGVSIEAATLPTEWETRTIKVSDPVGT